MLFEDILLLLGLGTSVFLIGIPFYKFMRAIIPVKRDVVKEAKIRLEAAKADAEAARLNHETEKVYDDIYHDVLEDNEETTNDRRRV